MDPISTHVNPEAIKDIEIIKGPCSVRHGQVLGGLKPTVRYWCYLPTIFEDDQVSFSVLNIWNATYYEYLNRPFRNMPESGILYEPGRNFTAMVRYNFGK